MVRGQREFKEGRNGLGLLSTLAQRRFGDGGLLEDALNRQSLMAGLDGWHFLDREEGLGAVGLERRCRGWRGPRRG